MALRSPATQAMSLADLLIGMGRSYRREARRIKRRVLAVAKRRGEEPNLNDFIYQTGDLEDRVRDNIFAGLGDYYPQVLKTSLAAAVVVALRAFKEEDDGDETGSA